VDELDLDDLSDAQEEDFTPGQDVGVSFAPFVAGSGTPAATDDDEDEVVSSQLPTPQLGSTGW
jgi:hypothetical protein